MVKNKGHLLIDILPGLGFMPDAEKRFFSL